MIVDEGVLEFSNHVTVMFATLTWRRQDARRLGVGKIPHPVMLFVWVQDTCKERLVKPHA